MNPESVMMDYVNYTQRAETQLVRDAVSTLYAQPFAELKALSERYTSTQTSAFRGFGEEARSVVVDPFGDYLRLGLNISKRGEVTMLHDANEFIDGLGKRAYNLVDRAFEDARGGKITYDVANDQMEKFGLGRVFTDKEAFDIAQGGPQQNLIKGALNKANMILATGMLRLDHANSLLNMISTPILLSSELQAIRHSVKNDPELFTQFNSLTRQALPGGEISIPSTTKLIFNAVAALVKPESKYLMTRFREIGTVRGPAALFLEVTDDLALKPNMLPAKYAAKVDEWEAKIAAGVEKGAKWSGNNFAEDATRFVTSHVMMQITDPLVAKKLMSVQEQNAFMSIFTNRVQGNYVASQRPIAFQGTLGSAVGLFQTYQFNLFQQLFRHIENRDLKTIATMGAMQGTIFGLNGLPFFDAINTHIVGNASINEKHNDAYSFAVQAAGKEVGDWMMYGTASAFPLFSDKAPALFSRGDLNPRNTFVLPTSWDAVPAVGASIKVVGNILDMAKQVSNGADVSDAFLFGLEHNGLNRPLAGLAQVVKGTSTTSKGNLIAASSDYLSIATAARLIGAKPMDESVALNALYRSKAYQAVDKERIDSLGIVIKEKLRGNEMLDPEDIAEFQARYAAAGGRIEGYTQAINRWQAASNTSVVNAVLQHSQTPRGQRMNIIMGGDMLQDYTTQVPEQ
jgi:hypothetical protein